MSRATRRQFLQELALIAASSVAIPSLARASAQPASSKRPRALIHVFPRGGIDPILSTNPRSRREVDRIVDVPYEESEILSVGATRVGPLLHQFAPYLSRMAILNNVDAATAGHHEDQAIQMRRLFPPTRIGLAGTVGALRRGDAVFSEVWFADRSVPFFPGGRSVLVNWWDGDQSLLGRLSSIAHDAVLRSSIDAALERELGRCTLNGGCFPIGAAHELIDRLAALEPFGASKPISLLGEAAPDTELRAGITGASLSIWGREIRDIVFLLKHRLTASIFLWPPFSIFDTHQQNLDGQRSCMSVFTAGMVELFRQLDATTTAEGTKLSDEVALVIGSEIGRFPSTNELRGKDHFPQLPFMLMGPGIVPGQYGEVDQRMSGVPISAQSGRPRGSQKDFVPYIDDLGATILSWFGIENSAAVGFPGRRLDFLLRT